VKIFLRKRRTARYWEKESHPRPASPPMLGNGEGGGSASGVPSTSEPRRDKTQLSQLVICASEVA